MKSKKMNFTKLINIGLILCLGVQFILLIVANLTLTEFNLDCDNGKLFSHIVEMCNNKTFFIKNWNNQTTLELDCVTLFAYPLYFITRNIFTAVGISNIIWAALFVLTVFYLFKDSEIIYGLVSANLLLIPYRTGMLDYYNMMFFEGSQYVVKVLTPILLISILLSVDRALARQKKISIADYVAVVVYFLLLNLTSISSGMYVAICGLLPVVTVYALIKLVRWDKVRLFDISILLVSFVVALAGMKVNASVMGQTRSDTMILTSVFELHGNIASSFFGMFELFGATNREGIRVLSFEGVGCVIKIVFVILMFASAIATIKDMILKKASDRRQFLLGLFIWDLFIMLVCKTRAGSDTSEFRYFLIGMVPLMFLTAEYFIDMFKRDTIEARRNIMFVVLCGFMVIMAAFSYKTMFAKPDTAPELKELLKYCESRNPERVYMYDLSNDSDILRAMDNSRPYLCLFEDGQTFAYDYYLKYCFKPMEPEGAIYVTCPEYGFYENFVNLGYEPVKIDAVSGYDIYIIE